MSLIEMIKSDDFIQAMGNCLRPLLIKNMIVSRGLSKEAAEDMINSPTGISIVYAAVEHALSTWTEKDLRKVYDKMVAKQKVN